MSRSAKQMLAFELNRLYKAVPGVSMTKLEAAGKGKNPPVKLGRGKLSSWMDTNTPAVPEKWEHLEFVVTLLWRKVTDPAGLRNLEWFKTQYVAAEAENGGHRGGRPSSRKTASPADGPDTLPQAPEGFVGRDNQVRDLLAWLDPARDTSAVAAVAGMAGVGKTTLAVRVAHIARRENWFPGGILFVDLHGYSDQDRMKTEGIAAHLLRILGVPGARWADKPEDAVQLWRDHARQAEPLLLVLDNAAHSKQIAPLLLDSPHRVLITSRRTQSAINALQVKLDPLTAVEALELLDKAVRIAHRDDDRFTSRPADGYHLAELCGHLPLALQIAVAQLRDESKLPLSSLINELADVRGRLDGLTYKTDDEGPPRAVRAALELSYTRLTEDEARMFRLLAAVPGPDVSTETAAVLLSGDIRSARRLLLDLARTHLINSDDSGERWSAHELVRLLAVERAEKGPDEIWDAQVRLILHYLDRMASARPLLNGGETESPAVFESEVDALAWFERERRNLVGLATYCPAAGMHGVATAFSIGLRAFLERRHYVDDWLTVSRAAVAERDKLADDLQSFSPSVHRDHAAALMAGRKFDEAIAVQKQELAAAATAGVPPNLTVLCDFGGSLAQIGRTAEAMATLRYAAALAREQGSSRHQATAANSLGMVYSGMGRHAKAIDLFTEAAATLRTIPDLDGETKVLVNLMNSLMSVDRFDEAFETYQRICSFFQDTGDEHNLAVATANFGAGLARNGAYDLAVSHCELAGQILQGTDDRYNEAFAWRTAVDGLARLERDDKLTELAGAAIKCFRAERDERSESRTWEHLAKAYLRTGKLDDAVEAYRQTAAAYRDGRLKGLREEIDAMTNFGIALQQLKRFEEAVEPFTLAAEKAKGLGDQIVMGYACANFASALTGVGRLDEAAENLYQALERIGDKDERLTRHILDNLPKVLEELGRTAEAAEIRRRPGQLP